jgi:hypothetical protein
MNTIKIPIKQILTTPGTIEEFEFIRRNPIASTIGGALAGGAIAHDYHKNGYHSVGNYIGDKIDTAKSIGSSITNASKDALHKATGPGTTKDPGHLDQSGHSNNFMANNEV